MIQYIPQFANQSCDVNIVNMSGTKAGYHVIHYRVKLIKEDYSDSTRGI